MKSKGMGWAGHGKRRSAYNILIGKPVGGRNLGKSHHMYDS
jgi:hypothetical protein